MGSLVLGVTVIVKPSVVWIVAPVVILTCKAAYMTQRTAIFLIQLQSKCATHRRCSEGYLEVESTDEHGHSHYSLQINRYIISSHFTTCYETETLALDQFRINDLKWSKHVSDAFSRSSPKGQVAATAKIVALQCSRLHRNGTRLWSCISKQATNNLSPIFVTSNFKIFMSSGYFLSSTEQKQWKLS